MERGHSYPLPPPPPPRPLQALAKHYAGTVVCLKLFGNSNDDTKRLFKEKLKARTTPSFYFFRGSEWAARGGRC